MKILISGAGIAGLTAAWFLVKQGHEVKIIEVAENLRDEGYMMDFFSPGYEVAEKMGILGDLKEKNHKISRFNFINEKGETKSSFSYDKLVKIVDNKYFLLLRGSLVDVLHEKVKDKVIIEYGTTIKHINQNSNEVSVLYSNGAKEKFDIVVGADGIHSKVRELVFGPEELYKNIWGSMLHLSFLKKI